MEVDVLKRKLLPLFKEHNIEKAILFGSLARNEASRRSDSEQAIKKAEFFLEQTRKLFKSS